MEEQAIPQTQNQAKPPRTPWTDDELRELERLYKKGYSLREISNVLGRTLDSVKGVIKRARFREQQRERERKNGFLSSGIKGALEKLGLDKREINRICKDIEKEGFKKKYFSSSNFFLTDAEAAMVVYRYLQIEKDLEGAAKLWREHIRYRIFKTELLRDRKKR